MNTTHVLLHLGDPSLHALEAIIFRRTIRRTFGKGGYRNYLQSYTIKDTMEYMSLSIGLTPIGSVRLKNVESITARGYWQHCRYGIHYNKKVLWQEIVLKRTRLQSNIKRSQGAWVWVDKLGPVADLFDETNSRSWRAHLSAEVLWTLKSISRPSCSFGSSLDICSISALKP